MPHAPTSFYVFLQREEGESWGFEFDDDYLSSGMGLAVVDSVAEESHVEETGLVRRGDTVLRVDGEAVSSKEGLKQALSSPTVCIEMLHTEPQYDA